MKVILVALYDVHSFAIRTFHGILENAGQDVRSVYVRNHYEGGEITFLELGRLRDEICLFDPNFICFSIKSMFFPLYKLIYKVCLWDQTIIVGGQHPTISPEDFIGIADYLCIGDGYSVFERGVNLSELWRTDNIAFPKPRSERMHKYDNLFPVYKFNDSEIYINANPRESHRKEIMASSGCPYSCT